MADFTAWISFLWSKAAALSRVVGGADPLAGWHAACRAPAVGQSRSARLGKLLLYGVVLVVVAGAPTPLSCLLWLAPPLRPHVPGSVRGSVRGTATAGCGGRG